MCSMNVADSEPWGLDGWDSDLGLGGPMDEFLELQAEGNTNSV